MNRRILGVTLRVDSMLQFLLGVAFLLSVPSVIARIGFPHEHEGHQGPQTFYASLFGAALIGIALAIWLSATRPSKARQTIWSGVVAKVLLSGTLLYWIFAIGMEAPTQGLGVAVVSAEMLFILVEGICLLLR